MKEVAIALYSLYTGTALAANTEDLYNTFAPEEAKEPYITFDFIAGLPDYTFDTRFEEVIIQFNIYSGNNSPVEVNNLYDNLKDVYDDGTLSVVGYQHVNMQRELNQLVRDIEEGVWQYIVQYRILIEAN